LRKVEKVTQKGLKGKKRALRSPQLVKGRFFATIREKKSIRKRGKRTEKGGVGRAHAVSVGKKGERD